MRRKGRKHHSRGQGIIDDVTKEESGANEFVRKMMKGFKLEISEESFSRLLILFC